MMVQHKDFGALADLTLNHNINRVHMAGMVDIAMTTTTIMLAFYTPVY